MSKEHLLHQYYCKEEALRLWITELTNSEEELVPGIDYFEKLRNGFILCRLVRKFNSRIIPKMNEDPNLPAYQLRRNISFFIEACTEYGVPRFATFTETELQENRNPPKILLTLELLAEKLIKSVEEYNGPVFEKIYEKLSLAPIKFPIYKRNEIELIEQIRASNMILVKLTRGENAWNRSNFQKPQRTSLISSSAHRKTKIELQMEEVAKKMNLKALAQFTPQIILIQNIFRLYSTRRSYFQRLKNETYRENVANEILSTERSYCENLHILIHEFLVPLKEKQNILVVDHIYSEVQIILAFSSVLLQDLEPRIANWNANQQIGDVFGSVSEYMKVYTQYVKDYSMFIGALCDAHNDKLFKAAITEIQSTDKTKGLSFESYLILPVQRIPRYEMLLKDLVRHTSNIHLDFENLNSSLLKIQNVAKYVNEKKRDFDNLFRVIELQKMFNCKENYAEPHRKLEGEYEISKLPRMKDYRLFLFNDLLLVAKVSMLSNAISMVTKQPNRYKIKANLDLQFLQIETESSTICRLSDENYSITFSSDDLPKLIPHIKTIQSQLSDHRSSRGLNIWKKNNPSPLYSQLESELKTLRDSNQTLDPRSKFMRKISDKILPNLPPRNVLDLVKMEEQGEDEDSRVVTRLEEKREEKKEKGFGKIRSSLRKGTGTLGRKDKKKMVEGLQKNVNKNSLGVSQEKVLKRARSRSNVT